MGAITGLVGAGLSAGSSIATTTMTNNANKQIAQMNNQFNEKMFDKQIAHNKEMYQQQLSDNWDFYNDQKKQTWDMWNATNEYNSPIAQVDRLRSAGLNPQLAINSGSTASVASSSSASSPSAQGINPPTATPYQADFSGISNGIHQAVELLNSTNLNREQVENLKIENSFKAAQTAAELGKLIADTDNVNVKTALERSLFSLNRDLMQADIDDKKASASLKNAEIRFKTTQDMMNQVLLKSLPEQQRLSIANATADLAVKYQSKELTKKQIQHEIAKIAKTYTERDNVIMQGNQMAIDQAEQVDTYEVRYNTLVAQMEKAIMNTGSDGFSGALNLIHQFGKSDKFSKYYKGGFK